MTRIIKEMDGHLLMKRNRVRFTKWLTLAATVLGSLPSLAETFYLIPNEASYHLQEQGTYRFDLLPQNMAQTHQSLHSLARHGHQISDSESPKMACGSFSILSAEQLKLALSLEEKTEDQRFYPPILASQLKSETVSTFADLDSTASFAEHLSWLEAKGSRHHSSATGLATPADLKARFESLLQTYPRSGVTVSLVDLAHSLTSQQSLVVKIPGSGAKTNEIIILGAHLDSINPTGSSAPGADDDATGIASLLEVFKQILSSNAVFNRSIELHAYSAEEVGLIGSGVLAQKYQTENKLVAAMLQLDMTGYQNPSRETLDKNPVFLVSNLTSPSLVETAKDLLTHYQGGDYQEKTLTAGTSDHSSWYRFGYATLFPFEDPEKGAHNPKIHTSGDTVAFLTEHDPDYSYSLRFIRLALSFLGHYAGLNDAVQNNLENASENEFSISLAAMPGTTSDHPLLVISTLTGVEDVSFCRKKKSMTELECKTGLRGTALIGTKGARDFFQADLAEPLDASDYLYVWARKDGRISGRRVQASKL